MEYVSAAVLVELVPKPMRSPTTSKCPVDEMGRNSVTPSTIPNRTASGIDNKPANIFTVSHMPMIGVNQSLPTVTMTTFVHQPLVIHTWPDIGN